MSTHFIIFLSIALLLLILLSAFFSSCETAMMALNRYRLRHQAREGVKAALRVSFLLKRPERLLSAILTGNTFVNVITSSIATVIAVHFLSDMGVLIASLIVTFMLLIFGEVAPKIVAAYYPQKWAMIVSWPLLLLLKLLNPIVTIVNMIASSLLWLLGFRPQTLKEADALSHDELRTVVREAKGRLPGKYLTMLLGTLDLQRLTINDVMVPRTDMYTVDRDAPWDVVLKQIVESPYTRIPIYADSVDQMLGILHLRDALKLQLKNQLNKESLMTILREPYFTPEGTQLYTQLINFQKQKRRTALVVDEYGDIQGLVTMEDILEEIVGEFTTGVSSRARMALPEEGGYIVSGNVNVRELNREMQWNLPADGPKTLSGLIVNELQAIPQAALSLRLGRYTIEVLQVKSNKVRKAKITPMNAVE